MVRTVWVDSWQMQCCGHPFQIGSEVSWTISPRVGSEFLAQVLGPDEALRITDAEEHHGGIPDDSPRTAGTVISIRAVFCEFAPEPGSNPQTRFPVVGTGVLEDRSSVDGWEPEDDRRHFLGYIVTMEVA